MRHSRLLRASLLCLVVTLAACSSTKKKDDEFERERIPVLLYEQQIEADPSLADIRVTLPEPYANSNWSQAGGAPAKAMHHLALEDGLKVRWRRSIGSGDDIRSRLIAPPVVADNRVFAIDTRGRITALALKTGERLWSVPLKVRKESKALAFGGGVAVEGGRLFATSGYGFAAAFDTATGNKVWQVELGVPLRGPPAVRDGRVFVMTIDNQLYALSAEKGEQLWDATGLVESAGLLGIGAPAVTAESIVVGYSSGELNALRVENGRTTWQDSLSRTTRLTALADLTDIDGSPVIDRGRVFAAGHAGRMAAIDLATGQRVWEQNIGSTSTPWVAGDYVYVVSNEGQVYCLTRSDGKVRWVTQLQRYRDVEDRKGVVRWQGPVLGGNRLVLISSNGYLASVSPYTGKILSVDRLKPGSYLPPIIAEGALLAMSTDAKITLLR